MRPSFHRNGSASGSTTAGRRLGLERPSLASMRVTTGRGFSNHYRGRGGAETDDDDDDNRGYDSYYDDDDDEEQKEREEERRLSERYGEAAEDAADGIGGGGKKRGNRTAGGANEADKDIAQEYAAQEKEKKKRKTGGHRSVTGDDLVKPNGLMAVHRGFPSKFHSSHAAVAAAAAAAASSGVLNKKRHTKYPKTVSGMAKYSRHLLAQYSEWMDGLLPGLPLEEGTWKIYTLMSKTNVKQFVQQMRDEVRNQHVERLLGLEPAERLLGQYQMDITAATATEAEYEEETRVVEEDVPMDDFAATNAEDPATLETDTVGPNAAPLRRSDVAIVTNPYGNIVTTNVTTPASSSDREGTTMEGVDQETTQVSPGQRSLRSATQEAQAEAVTRTVHKKSIKKNALDDSSDEEEALFDDVIPAAGGASMDDAATKKRRVSVFQEDDDDDDDEDEMKEKSAEENDKGDKILVGDEETGYKETSQTRESKNAKINSGIDNARDGEDGHESSEKKVQLKASADLTEERQHEEIADLPLTQLSEVPSVSATQLSQAPTVHGSQLHEEDGAGLNHDWDTTSRASEQNIETPTHHSNSNAEEHSMESFASTQESEVHTVAASKIQTQEITMSQEKGYDAQDVV